MREEAPAFARNEPHEVALDLDRILGAREPESLREPPNVGIDDDPLRVAELRRDDVSGLSRDTRKAYELVQPRRDTPVEVSDEHLHRAS